MASLAPKPHLPCENLNNVIPSTPIRINFPVQKPDFNPPKPTRIKPQPRKSPGKPITTSPSDVFRLMDSLKLSIPTHIYASLIKECTELGDPVKAIEVHRHIRSSGLRLDLPLLNRVLLMYASCGCYEDARQLFDQMFLRNLNSWAVVIAACVENEEYSEAVELFVAMLREVRPESLSDRQSELTIAGMLVCVLKSCLHMSDIELGMQVHGWLWKMGYSSNDFLNSFLVNFYGKLKCFEGAESVFEQGHGRNTAVWTSRIMNFCNDGDFEGAIGVFRELVKERVMKNAHTFSLVLKACGRVGDIRLGQEVHASVLRLGLESNAFVQSALVDMYGRCGFLDGATRVFESGREMRNVVCYNALLFHYVQHGLCVAALRLVHEMKMYGLLPHPSLINELSALCGDGVPENEMDKICAQHSMS